MTTDQLAEQVCTDIRSGLLSCDPGQLDGLVADILAADQIALYGVGREGLMMKALAMRLMHLELKASVVGDMTTPALGGGDLLIVSAGPGHFATVDALVTVAREAGASSICFTAQPDGPVPQRVTRVVTVPVQTMADAESATGSVLPMGSQYEIVLLLLGEILVYTLGQRLGLSAADMARNHTNLE
ncbi:SIS domain-containing protein [Rhodophyticola sp. CCM32]|uniref:SIS domain-containing protein n=1 Tax=Rhodophyticola sp. CCM32 TaxID=2916397 RepID=UPI00107FD125|nr:SIS domain-containing protein [Rhodophyticola sp. CCM32]QBX99937.1 SIS domain-containing protein [Rhodophyticola sp. CCM32]